MIISHCRNLFSALLLAVLMVSTAACASVAQSYTILDLGDLPYHPFACAYALNDSGQVAGAVFGDHSDDLLYNPFAFLWQGGKMTALGTLYGPGTETQNTSDPMSLGGLSVSGSPKDLNRISQSAAYGINLQGQVVGETFVSPLEGNYFSRAFLWQNGNATDLGTLPGDSFSSAYGVNNSSRIVGYSAGVANDNPIEHAVLWQDGAIIDLGTLGGTQNWAYAINDVGQVVGWSYPDAFLWQNGVMTDLGTLPGGWTSQARAINIHGQIAGSSANGRWYRLGEGNDYVVHACLWENGVMTDLGKLANGTKCEALGINDSGQVVGYSTTQSERYPHAFLFNSGKMYDLNTLLPPQSGWKVHYAEAINNAGQIVGVGSFNGTPRAFLMTPVSLKEDE